MTKTKTNDQERTKKEAVRRTAIPKGKDNWKLRREMLLDEYVRPLIPTCRQRQWERQREERNACLSLKEFKLDSVVDPDVMVVLNKLLNDVEKINSFPDFIEVVYPPGPPWKHTKYCCISYFSTFEEGSIRDMM